MARIAELMQVTFSELVVSLLLSCGTQNSYHMLEEIPSRDKAVPLHSLSMHRWQLSLKPYQNSIFNMT